MSSSKGFAVVACNSRGHGCVLWHLGLSELDDFNDLEDMGLDDAPLGVSVWEGHICYSRDFDGEWDFDLRGEYRSPSDKEWEAIQDGANPFDAFRCQYSEICGCTTDTHDGPETETWEETCEEVAVENGFCNQHAKKGISHDSKF